MVSTHWRSKELASIYRTIESRNLERFCNKRKSPKSRHDHEIAVKVKGESLIEEWASCKSQTQEMGKSVLAKFFAHSSPGIFDP